MLWYIVVFFHFLYYDVSIVFCGIFYSIYSVLYTVWHISKVVHFVFKLFDVVFYGILLLYGVFLKYFMVYLYCLMVLLFLWRIIDILFFMEVLCGVSCFLLCFMVLIKFYSIPFFVVYNLYSRVLFYGVSCCVLYCSIYFVCFLAVLFNGVFI